MFLHYISISTDNLIFKLFLSAWKFVRIVYNFVYLAYTVCAFLNECFIFTVNHALKLMKIIHDI